MPASRVTVNTWAVTDADGNKLRRRVVAVLHALVRFGDEPGEVRLGLAFRAAEGDADLPALPGVRVWFSVEPDAPGVAATDDGAPHARR